jgi:hypothetical protein
VSARTLSSSLNLTSEELAARLATHSTPTRGAATRAPVALPPPRPPGTPRRPAARSPPSPPPTPGVVDDAAEMGVSPAVAPQGTGGQPAGPNAPSPTRQLLITSARGSLDTLSLTFDYNHLVRGEGGCGRGRGVDAGVVTAVPPPSLHPVSPL